MLTLHQLQQRFADNLKNLTSESLNFISPNTVLTAAQHFSIYQNSIRGARQKVLQELYPVCNKLVGDDFFIAMANEYISQKNSISPDLADYGDLFPKFITHFTPAKTLPYLADVAHLEWLWHRIFHAEENTMLDFEKLSAYMTQGESIVFLLQPDSHLLHSPFPIHRIWEINQPDYTGEVTLKLKENEAYFLLVWRKQLTLRMDILTQVEWQILSWMQQSCTLGKIAEQMEMHFPDIQLSEILTRFIAQRWIGDFVITH